MINVTKLLCDSDAYGDSLRYAPRDEGSRRPVVVWNATRRCNLSCVHCYADASASEGGGELSTGEAKAMLGDLSAFGVPVVLFSGGEPLLRKDILELAAFAKDLRMRSVLSTNGTLITRRAARDIRSAGMDYVGVSVDGIGERNDAFRGMRGAFEAALSGLRNLKEAGQRAGLRLTLTKRNYLDLDGIFALAEREDIERVCFYHLVYSGRGRDLRADDLSHAETRRCVDMICAWALSQHLRGMRKEILTVDNHTDNAYIYMMAKRADPARSGKILGWLRSNGGNGSGVSIANIDHRGFVFPDQFWHEHGLGDVRSRRFSEIWSDGTDAFLSKLRNRKALLKGRCARCAHVDICNGNFRARAETVYEDMWGEDPACYLTDDEIAVG